MAAKKCVIDRGGAGTKSTVVLPRFRPKQGAWTGGDSHTLYTFTFTNPTGTHTMVRPGGGTKASSMMKGIGPDATVRVATKDEAEKHWQSPLHSGWKIACED